MLGNDFYIEKNFFFIKIGKIYFLGNGCVC